MRYYFDYLRGYSQFIRNVAARDINRRDKETDQILRRYRNFKNKIKTAEQK